MINIYGPASAITIPSDEAIEEASNSKSAAEAAEKLGLTGKDVCLVDGTVTESSHSDWPAATAGVDAAD